MTEFLVCFNWCNGEQPPPKRRRRLDRNMIGEPMNFVHTAHVGAGEMSSDYSSVIRPCEGHTFKEYCEKLQENIKWKQHFAEFQHFINI